MAGLPWTNKNCYNCAWWDAKEYGIVPDGYCRKHQEDTDEYDNCDEWEERYGR